MRPEDFELRPSDLGAGNVRVKWLGTAGFAISHGEHTVLIDPYLTRASLARCAFSTIASDEEAVRRHIDRADAIIVGHTHFDHALDVPLIARITGAKVFGSHSAWALCRTRGLPESHVEDVERPHGGAPLVREVGPFRLRFMASAHSRLALGRVPFPGEIADCDEVPLRVSEYKCGAVFGVEIQVAGRTIFHVGSAELVDANVSTRNVDLALVCTAGWTSSRDFPERIARALSPRVALLSHWDDFFRPIEAGARALPAMKLPQFVDRLTRAAREITVGTVPLMGEIAI